MIKTEKEIREELQNCKEAMNNNTEEIWDYLIFKGWIEALEFVLANSLPIKEPLRNNNCEPL